MVGSSNIFKLNFIYILDMDLELQKFFKQNRNPFPGQDLRFNSELVVFAENRFFRCKVLRIEKNEKAATAFLIDEGRSLKIPLGCFFGLPLEFSTMKPCAQLCHLEVIPRVGDVWNEENGLDYFKSTCYERQLNCSMMYRQV